MNRILLFSGAEVPVSSPGFQSMVNVFVFILLVFVVLLLLILFCMYINTIFKVRKRDNLRQNIEAAIKKSLAAKTDKDAEQPLLSKDLFTRRGLAVLADVLETMDEKQMRRLQKILLGMDVYEHLLMQLKNGKEDYLMEIIHLAGELNLSGLSDEIVRIIFEFSSNIGIQYESMLALARMGSYEHIAEVCKRENFSFVLSFRSLQEIIDSYTGDKPKLYKELLGSPDAYVTRICIRCIGYEKIDSLAEDVLPFLGSDNINIVDDAMRTLGMLAYKPAAEKIAAFLNHGRWEVRSIAVSALAALDPGAYADDFIKAMQDSEWQVRYNAGAALASLKDSSSIAEKVKATGDNFAQNMWDYMSGIKNIGKG